MVSRLCRWCDAAGPMPRVEARAERSLPVEADDQDSDVVLPAGQLADQLVAELLRMLTGGPLDQAYEEVEAVVEPDASVLHEAVGEQHQHVPGIQLAHVLGPL